jgi:RNA polymerase sigma-70 factor (ECF subfamily)
MASPKTRQTPDRALQDLWVARLQEGCTDTLREVVEAFGERIRAVVSGILRDKDAVEDVVQETFTKAFYRIGGFKGGSSLYTWLYRIAVNASKDYIKSRARRPASSLEDLPAPAATIAAPRAVPLEGIERRELRERVRAAIDSLPTKFRTVLALRELDGMPYHQIAEVLGLSLGTVESRLFRARRRLRSLLAKDPALGGPRGTSIGTDKGSKGTA